MTCHWEEKNLGEVITLEYGKPLSDDKRTPEGKYPVYGANGEKDKTNEFYYDKPSIIVGRKGSAGEVNLTEKRFWPLDVTYFVTFDEKKYNLKFLFNLLLTLNLPKLAKGVKPGINRNEVYGITVKTPPLPEQERIVSFIDGVFEKAAKAKENAEKNLQNAREFFESYLQSIFANPGDDWERCNLEDYIKFIDYRGRTPEKTGSGMRLITAKNVKNGYLQIEPREYVHPSIYKTWMTRGIPEVGDVLFTTEAPLANVAQLNTDEKVAEEFLKSIFGALPEFFKNEDELRRIWSNPITRKALLEKLFDAGYGKDELSALQKLINAEKSDLFDVLEYISFAIKPITREKRVAQSQIKIFNGLDNKQKEFVEFVLSKYIESGVEELDQGKLPDLLTLKYQAIRDAEEILGGVDNIRTTFIEFQKYLYEEVAS